MTQGLRTKSADLDIVFHQAKRLADAIDSWREKLPLIIEAIAPGQNASHVQSFTFNLQKHLPGEYSFGG